MDQWERDFNRAVEDGLNNFINGFGRFIKNFSVGVFYGTKKLKNKNFLIGFIITICIMFLTIKFKSDIATIPNVIWRYITYYGLLLSPLLYLKIISGFGMRAGKRLVERLNQYKFYGVDGKLPVFLGQTKDDFGLDIIKFQAAIPLKTWKASRDELESLFNKTIVSIDQDTRKDRVILRTIPGTAVIPEKILWDDKYINYDDGVVVIGRNAIREISFDLNKTPHVLSAGETGSGKSVILRAMLWQLLKKGCRAYMIDFKGGVEFGKAYEKYGQVITEKEEALAILSMLTKENAKRLNLFREMEVKNLYEYNQKTNSNLCRVVVIVDELAELLDSTGLSKEEKELLAGIEKELSTLARLSRATGINLLLGVQRPDAKVITGQIKSNVPVRICGRFADNSASEIVLSNTRAKDLKDIKGRFLIKLGADTEEFQAYYFDDKVHLKDININKGGLLTENKEMDRISDEVSEDIIKEIKSEKKSKKNIFKIIIERLKFLISFKKKWKEKKMIENGADPDLLDLDTLYDDNKNVEYGENTPFGRIIVNKEIREEGIADSDTICEKESEEKNDKKYTFKK